MEYIGIIQEYSEHIPLYSQNPTLNGTIFPKKDHIFWNFEEYGTYFLEFGVRGI